MTIRHLKRVIHEYLIWNSQILDCIATDITFGHSPKPITILQLIIRKLSYYEFNLPEKEKEKKKQIQKKKKNIHKIKVHYFRSADDFPKMNVHPCITINQMAVVSLTIFQFHQLLEHRNYTLLK